MPEFYRTKEAQRRLFVVRLINGASLLLGIYCAISSSIMLGLILACLGLLLGFTIFCRMLRAEMKKYYQKSPEPGEYGPDVYYCLDKYWQEIFHRLKNLK